MNAFGALVARDIRIALRQLSDTMTVIVFFVIAAALFPFGVGADPNLLARMAPGILWVTALLAAMLSFDRLFQNDYEDGTLELLVVAPQPVWLTALAKIAAHWLTTGLPLLVASPVIGIMLNLEPNGYGVLMAAMALGTAIISLVGALGAALTLGSRSKRSSAGSRRHSSFLFWVVCYWRVLRCVPGDVRPPFVWPRNNRRDIGPGKSGEAGWTEATRHLQALRPSAALTPPGPGTSPTAS